jgi:hypothetical protein
MKMPTATEIKLSVGSHPLTGVSKFLMSEE